MNKYIDITKTKRIEFRNDINGLRAVSVLVVVFYHAGINFFKGGWLGVDIFFVISGFLISNIIISQLNDGTFKFKEFYFRRIKRIFPALYSTLLISIPFAWLFLGPESMIEYSNSLFSSVLFYSNYYFNGLDFYNTEPSKFMPLLHTWSLAIEEQFYIFYPITAFLIFKFFKKYFLYIFGLIVIFSIYLNSLPKGFDKFYLLQYRIWELLLGVLVMILSQNFRSKHLEKIGFLLMFIPILLFDDTWINDIEPKIICIFGVCLILLNGETQISKKLSSIKPIKLIGLSSFSIYLLHQPVFAFFRTFARGKLYRYDIFDILLLILLTIFLGYISFEYVEKRLPKLKYFTIILIIIATVVLIFSLFGNLSNGFPSRFENNFEFLKLYYSNEEINNEIGQRQSIDRSKCLNLNENFQSEYFCNLSYFKGNENIVIIGDSHLETTAKNIFDNYDKNTYNLFIYLQSGCPFVVDLNNNSSRASCGNKSKETELLKILKDNDSTIIFGGRFPWYFNGKSFETNFGSISDNIPPGKEDLIIGLKNNIEFFQNNSNKLILIYPIPELGYYPLEPYLYGYYRIDEEITYDYKYWESYSYEVNKYLDSIENKNVNKIFSEKFFCNSFFLDSCTSSNNGIFYYWDDDHLTINGASFISNEIFELLDE